MGEAKFERRSRTAVLYSILFLFNELWIAFVVYEWVREGAIVKAILLQGGALLLGVFLFYPVLKQRWLRFTDEGLEYSGLFESGVLRWDQITAVSNVSLNKHGVLELTSLRKKLRISLSEFSDGDAVVRYIDSKLNEARSSSSSME